MTSTNAARLFGLFPRKGTPAVGADADIVVWDPRATRAVDSRQTQTRADFSPYEGREVTGWPIATINRGELVYAAERIVGEPGRGRLVPRGPSQML